MPVPIQLIATLLAIASSVPLASTHAADVRIKQRASVSGDVIRLADVADVTETNAKARIRLEQILLGPAPLDAREVRLKYADIRSKLQSAGVDLSRVDFSGSAAVRVTSSVRGSNISQSKFLRIVPAGRQNRRAERAEQLAGQVIEQHLRRVVPMLGRVNIRVSLDSGDVEGVLSAFNGAFAVRTEIRPRLGTQRMRLLYRDRHRRTHSATVRCVITEKPYVLAARNRIPRGETIQNYDVELVQTDSVNRGFTRVTAVVGQLAKRTIRKGSVFENWDIRRVPLVHANAMVTVTVRIGDIRVSRQMVAKKTGALGETIPVTQPKGRKIATAIVTGLNQAEIVQPHRPRLAGFRDETGSIEFRNPRTTIRKTSATAPASRHRSRTSSERWKTTTSRKPESYRRIGKPASRLSTPIRDEFRAVSKRKQSTRVVGSSALSPFRERR